MSYIVYAGRREDINNGLYHLFYFFQDLILNTVDSDERLFMKRPFDKPLFKNPSVGAIYECELVNEGKSISYNKNAKPVAFWKNNDARVKWQALESAAKILESIQKEVKDNKLIERLQPIREAYRTAGTQNKRNILAEVIRIITT